MVIIFVIKLASYAYKILKYKQGKDVLKKTIKEVLKQHTEQLMALPGVVGTGQGLCNNKPCIKVFVIKIKSELTKKIPKELNGYSVSVEETGEIKAL